MLKRTLMNNEKKLEHQKKRLLHEIEKYERLHKQREEYAEAKKRYNELKYARAKRIGRATLSSLGRFGMRVGENSRKYYGWKR